MLVGARAGNLEAHMWEYGEGSVELTIQLHTHMCKAMSLSMYMVTCTRRVFGAELCGAAALAFLRHRLLDEALPDDHFSLLAFHQGSYNEFADMLAAQTITPRPWVGG